MESEPVVQFFSQSVRQLGRVRRIRQISKLKSSVNVLFNFAYDFIRGRLFHSIWKITERTTFTELE